MKPKSRIPSVTRWSMDEKTRLDRAKTEIEFFNIMVGLFGDKFKTPTNKSIHRAAERILARVKPAGGGGTDAVEN